MNIGFDGKRYFHNSTGLGNYSRTLVDGLAGLYPEHKFYLFNPKRSGKYDKFPALNVHEILPAKFPSNKLTSMWRSNWVKKDLQRLSIDLYHGLSHEIPVGLHKTSIPSVVTIHDLIFEKYPEQFKKIDIQIYRKKFRYACSNADRIIAISKQTKNDIVELYGIKEEKIDVCYQSCNPAFANEVSEDIKEQMRRKYDLPQKFMLYVGSIIPRKNLLNICKAITILKEKMDIHLVIIGSGKTYKEEVKQYIKNANIESSVIFLSETIEGSKEDFQKPSTFAAIYQMAELMVYPSFYEGFGIPVMESLWSKLPVITSNVSCLPETGGDGAIYVDPASPGSIAEAMYELLVNDRFRQEQIEKGWSHAQNFTQKACCDSVMQVYYNLLG